MHDEFGPVDTDRPTVECPNCAAEQHTDTSYDGEISRGTNCVSCGDWFSVDLEQLRQRV